MRKMRGLRRGLLSVLYTNLLFLTAIPLCSKVITGHATYFGIKPMFIVTASMEPVISARSWIIVMPVKAEELAAGDVAAYRKENGTRLRPLIVHRIIGITDEGFIFKGDGNEQPDRQMVKPDQVVYKVVYPDVSRNREIDTR